MKMEQEFITEIIKYSEVRNVIDEKVATIMLSGILLDTNYYRRQTGIRTFESSAILKELGAVVKVKDIIPWRFDVARNESMKLIPEDANILVCTDLDEVLESGWAQVLRDRWIEGVHTRATYKYAWSHYPNGEPARVFQYNKVHSKEWIWNFPVHEGR